jgi:hypothetical protein
MGLWLKTESGDGNRIAAARDEMGIKLQKHAHAHNIDILYNSEYY